MRNSLAKDISRCLNEECTLKNSCIRYLQNKLDIANNETWISFTEFRQKKNGTCDYYIPNK